MAEINEHINRCYDAQFVVEKRKVVHERKKLKLDTKGNVITKGKEFGDTTRSESLKCLQKGNTKEVVSNGCVHCNNLPKARERR